MANFTTLSTGFVSGLTGLKVQTIQRYVRKYPEGFSDAARQQKQGRRFSGQDIKALLLIHHMLRNRQKKMLPAALRGEWSPPDSPLFDVQDFMQGYQAMREQNARAEHILQETAWKLEVFQRQYSGLIADIKRHAAALDKLKERVDRLALVRDLQFKDRHTPS